ncbi:T-cell surface glycoprotein CD3 gamma chain-like isoform X3 [Cetorhinus maximus]
MRCQVQLIIVTIVTILLFELVSAVEIKDFEGGLKLKCDNKIAKNGFNLEKSEWSLTDEDHGLYGCIRDTKISDESEEEIYVYFKKCTNCVDIKGISGILIASISFTIFIGIAVYSVSAPGRSWSHQASDRHPLMRNDAAEAIYSHLDNAGKSMYSELGRRR